MVTGTKIFTLAWGRREWGEKEESKTRKSQKAENGLNATYHRYLQNHRGWIW